MSKNKPARSGVVRLRYATPAPETGWLYLGEHRIPGPIPAQVFKRDGVLVLSSLTSAQGRRGLDYHVSVSCEGRAPDRDALDRVRADYGLPDDAEEAPGTKDPTVVHLFAPVPADELPTH